MLFPINLITNFYSGLGKVKNIIELLLELIYQVLIWQVLNCLMVIGCAFLFIYFPYTFLLIETSACSWQFSKSYVLTLDLFGSVCLKHTDDVESTLSLISTLKVKTPSPNVFFYPGTQYGAIID